MTGLVRVVPDDAHFQIELSAAGNKLVVADFTAGWCNPCQRIAPVFEEFSVKYPKAVFLKVDVNECQDTATSQGVTSMPTFIFYRNKVKVGQMSGANGSTLEARIVELLATDEGGDTDVGVSGHMDLVSMLDKSGCECLNESDDHPFVNCLQMGESFLESDCDEQLIISITFNQAVKLHSFKITAAEDKGPKTLKLFINQPRTLDFDQAVKMESVQTLQIERRDLSEGRLIPLRFVKFQNVQNLQIFVKDNQDGVETTQINHLCIIGSPINTTNMGEFKRVAGKKGESH